VSSFTAGTEKAQKCFPWTGATELQLHIWREKKGCPVHTRLQRMQGREFKKLAGNGCRGGKGMQTGYSTMLTIFPGWGCSHTASSR